MAKLTAELSGQRTEGRPTLSLHASGIEDNDPQTMRLLSQGRTAFAPRFYEIKERDLTLCACQLKGNNSDAPRLKVKDEQLPLSIKVGTHDATSRRDQVASCELLKI